MIKIKRQQFQKFLYFAETNLAYIKSHQEKNQIIVFNYVIPINVDQSIIDQASGDFQVRGFSSKKRRPAVTVKRSDIAGSNIIKKIDQQRIEQIASQKYTKKFFFERYIDRPDLKNKQFEFNFEITSARAGESFSIEIALIRLDGSTTVIDTVEINHTQALKMYDLPSDNFYISSTRDSYNKIFVSAASQDPMIKSFVFMMRRDSSSGFLTNKFEMRKDAIIEGESMATVSFGVGDVDQSYTIRAYPVSKFLNQKIGNFKETSLQYVNNVKQIPFYLKTLEDSRVQFGLSRINKDIKKIFLFRENLISGNREFVASYDNMGRNSLTLEDNSRIFQLPYVYTCEYADQTGMQLKSPSYVLVPALRLDKLAKITVLTNRNITQTSLQSQKIATTAPNQQQIQFNVEVSYSSESLYDQIVEDIKSLGLESLVSSDLEKMTNNLKPITRVLVSRISLDTGEQTEVGVFQPGLITVPNPNSEESCIFRFEAAVRSMPESLEMLASGQQVLSNNSTNLKNSIDLISKQIGNRAKNQSTNFSAKFFTKSSLLNSTLKYGDSLSLEDLSYYAGRTGVFADYYINTSNDPGVNIRNIKLLKTKKGNYITWSATGDLSKISLFNIKADDNSYISHPTPGGQQTFYIGNFQPKKIIINTDETQGIEGKKVQSAEIRNDN